MRTVCKSSVKQRTSTKPHQPSSQTTTTKTPMMIMVQMSSSSSSNPKRIRTTTTSAGSGDDDDEEDDYDEDYIDDYRLNPIPNIRQPKRRRASTLNRQQSLTFIADLAQTSTPTRAQAEPITSTPKQLTHDPLKYHPTQTIRCKKTSTSTRISTNPPQRCSQCLHSQKRKRIDETMILGHQNPSECNLCSNLSRAVSSIGRKRTHKRRTGREVVKLVKRGSSSSSAANCVEISLQDLLYAPNKFDLVTTNRPVQPQQRVVRKQQSKIYYL